MRAADAALVHGDAKLRGFHNQTLVVLSMS